MISDWDDNCGGSFSGTQPPRLQGRCAAGQQQLLAFHLIVRASQQGSHGELQLDLMNKNTVSFQQSIPQYNSLI